MPDAMSNEREARANGRQQPHSGGSIVEAFRVFVDRSERSRVRFPNIALLSVGDVVTRIYVLKASCALKNCALF